MNIDVKEQMKSDLNTFYSERTFIQSDRYVYVLENTSVQNEYILAVCDTREHAQTVLDEHEEDLGEHWRYTIHKMVVETK